MIDETKMKKILSKLSETRPVFHMEADFQIALFRATIDVLGDPENVYLEKLEDKDLADRCKERKHPDIYIKNENMDVAIEIKYKTTSLEKKHGNEVFRLKKQGGQTEALYDFWHDIDRLQEIVKKGNGKTIGFALFLTNDKSYWEPGCGAGLNREFKINDGREIRSGETLMGVNKKKKVSVVTDHNYALKWRPYDGSEGLFKYLLVQIPPRVSSPMEIDNEWDRRI